MRAVIQRVTEGRVHVDGEIIGEIGPGLVVLLGVGREDGPEDVQWMAAKILNLRIFQDDDDKTNLSLLDTGGQALVVSQFTLQADSRKGRRPSFVQAADPEMANKLYLEFVDVLKECDVETATGSFGAMMKLSLVNDGPVTIILDSKKLI